MDYSLPVYLIAEPEQLSEATRILHKIGLDKVNGFFSVSEVRDAGLTTESYENAPPRELVSRIESGELKLIDVRSNDEWKNSHIKEAEHRFLGHLLKDIAAIDVSQEVVTQCQEGNRSAIASCRRLAAMSSTWQAVSEHGVTRNCPSRRHQTASFRFRASATRGSIHLSCARQVRSPGTIVESLTDRAALQEQ